MCLHNNHTTISAPLQYLALLQYISFILLKGLSPASNVVDTFQKTDA